jgi:hypothetical protein
MLLVTIEEDLILNKFQKNINAYRSAVSETVREERFVGAR